MQAERMEISGIPALVWGDRSEKVYLCVHGKMSSKESARELAQLAAAKGYQTIAFDLPQHGERRDEPQRCDIWNGIHDLTVVADYVFRRWREVSLYACSLGAYFSLHAYPDRPFVNCLFQSPVLDMEYLIRQLFLWFGVTEERLAAQREIVTPIDVLSWDYFQYVLAHPVTRWSIPTSILYGGKDNLQLLSVMEDFAARFGSRITLSPDSEHPFMQEQDFPVVRQWLQENL